MNLPLQREVLSHIMIMLAETDLTNLCYVFSNIDKSNYFDFVYTSLRKSRTFQRIFSEPKILKSNDTAIKYRMNGNEMYQKKKYMEALKYYTKSIKFAENDSSYLGMAYANRSAVFFEKKYFKECLEDIKRALESNYPEQLMNKLLKRQRNAERLKQNQRPLGYYGNTPQVLSKNPLIDAASDSVEIQTNTKFGKHIVGTRDIKIGELIVAEKPYVQVVHPKYRLFHCHECLKLCYNMIPCTNCTTALYCNKDCRTKAFATYHKYECNFVEYFHKQPLLFMKMVIVGLQDSNVNNDACDNTYCSNRFKEIKALSTNEDERGLLTLPSVAIACLGFHCLKRNKDVCLEFDLENNESLIMDLLYKCAMIENCNEFTIGMENKRDEDVYFGEAIYSFISLFNHYCAPNFFINLWGSDIVIRAKANIKKGEQCLISYGFLYQEMPVSKRQELLENSYFFNCDCRACNSNWPTLEKLPLGTNIPHSFHLKKAFYLVGLNEVILKDLLTEASNIYDILKLQEPCQNMWFLKSDIITIFNMMTKQCFKQFDAC